MADGLNQNNKDGISAKFVSVGTGVSLEDRDIIAIGPHSDKSAYHVDNIDAERAINFRSILENGLVPLQGRASFYGMTYNQNIDFDQDDAYTRALDDITRAVQKRIDVDPKMQELLKKESWSRDDRVDWERRTSRYVSEEADNIQGLGGYRHANFAGKIDNPFSGSVAETRALNVNDLAQDIENDTEIIEYDCETMSLTEGAVLQRIEDANLPMSAPIEGSFKESSSYFYTSGLAFSYDPNLNNFGHAFIVSSATGSVIEATADPSNPISSYQEAPEGYSFQDFANGAPVFGVDFSYVSYGAGGLTGDAEDYYKIDMGDLAKISKGDNGRTFQDHLDEAAERSIILREHIGEMQSLPETEALREISGVQGVRSLSPMESGALNDLRYNSAASDEFDTLDARVADLKETLMNVESLAGNDPEKLRQLHDFLQEQQARFGSLDTQTPYAVHNDETLGVVSAYGAEDTINGELDAAEREIGLKARIYERLDNQADVQQPEQHNDSTGLPSFKF